MSKLTKEECLKALNLIEEETTEIEDYESFPYITFNCFEKEIAILKQLIYEYFELLEKYQNLQDENARLSFDKIVNNIEDMNYKLWLENPPLKFEEIEKETWIWDKKEYQYLFVANTYDDWFGNGKKALNVWSINGSYDMYYEENRFYRKRVE